MTRKEIDEIYSEIYDYFIHELKAYCVRFTRNDTMLAEELAQQACFNLWVVLNDMGTAHVDNYKAYLRTTARNLIFNYYRDNRKLMYIDWPGGWADIELDSESAEIEYMEYESIVKYHQGLLQIKAHSEKWYYILMEVYLKERSQTEVAKEMGMTQTGMYSCIRRIRTWAKKNLIDLYIEV